MCWDREKHFGDTAPPKCNAHLQHVIVCCYLYFFQGVNVREKAKQLVTLLKDEERLREERIHALKTKEKMAQTSSGEMGT